jgi:putative spermidine/putrescine transport system ATP-binding protein
VTALNTASPAGTTFEHLEMRDVTRIYGSAPPALSNLNLELRRNEFVALLGPSGCGKSTALACLAGLQPLSNGTIWRDETRIDQLPAERRGFGMVFQNYALFPHMTVLKNVEFGLTMRKVARPERTAKAKEALSLVQLTEHGDRLPGQLSGGQQQRVAIARALAIDPEIILMDEPLSNLDATLRIEMRTEIKRLYQERGLTVLYVTHDQEEALSLATRLVVLRLGRAEQTGTPEEVYTHPVSAYVAGFMGYRNLFPAQATEIAGTPGSADLVRVDSADISLVGAVKTAGGLTGSLVTVAIRPEDITIASADSANHVKALAQVVEYHGREMAVQARTASGTVLHLKTNERVTAGDNIALTVTPDRVLVYDGSDELAKTRLDQE